MIIAGGQILKMTVSRFVDVSEKKMVTQQILTTVMTRIVVDKSTDHAKPHSICFFTTISKITKEIFVNIYTDSDLKVHAPHFSNELLVRVRLSCQKTFWNSLNMQKQ